MCLVSPDLSSIEQMWHEQCNLGIFDNFRLLSIKMSAESPERRATLSASICPRYDAVIVAGDGNVCFLTNLTQVN